MAARRPNSNHNRLEEAMALLINNQAAFVGQIARNDQERLALQRRSDEQDVKSAERWRKTEEWHRKSEERFERIEERLARIEADLIQLPKTMLQTILEQLPKAVKKEIGFKTQT
jgi:ectoine hydroxylase-related dioxygenase (phytanoyl-CoA dioxygenase family)